MNSPHLWLDIFTAWKNVRKINFSPFNFYPSLQNRAPIGHFISRIGVTHCPESDGCKKWKSCRISFVMIISISAHFKRNFSNILLRYFALTVFAVAYLFVFRTTFEITDERERDSSVSNWDEVSKIIIIIYNFSLLAYHNIIKHRPTVYSACRVLSQMIPKPKTVFSEQTVKWTMLW